MPSLREVQERLAAALLADAPPPLAEIADGRFAAERLLQIYRNNVFVSLTGALAAVHPVVQRLVGEGFFQYAADGYIRHHPPARGNLHDFGESFAEFLASFEPAGTLAYLPDVARLEWLWHEAFHAPDAPPLALERLAQVPPAEYAALRFTLHPAARLLASPWPILRIWQANQESAAGEIAPVSLDEGGVRLLIRRRELEVAIEPLGAGDHALLTAFRDGLTLAAATDAALAAEPDFDLPARLQYHVAGATVAGFAPA